MKRWGLVFGLAVLWLGGEVFPAHGYSLLDDKLSVSGYVQNQSSYRLGDGSKWVSSENRLQVEMEAKLHPDVSVRGIFRVIYDAIYDLRHDSDQWNRDYAGSRGLLAREEQLRELHMDATLGNWDFRIGKQQVVWGESDGLRLMDLVNPLDMRRQNTVRPYEDIRIPLTMVKAVYRIDPGMNSYLEFLWNPGDIKRDLIYNDTTISEDYKSPWTLPNSPALLGLKALRLGGKVVMPNDDPSWLNVRNSEFGTRLGGILGGWSLTLNYFQGFSRLPVLEGNINLLAPPSSLPVVPVKIEYPRERVIGFTFNKDSGMWVWRGEFATYLDKHYTVAVRRPAPDIMIEEKVMQASMLGFDYKRNIPWLNPEKLFFISGQIFNFHIFDFEETLRPRREDSVYLTLLVNTGYHMERIVPEVLVIFDTAATGWQIKSKVEFKYGDHWRPEIGSVVYIGDDFEQPFGMLAAKDEIWIRLKYQF